MSQLKNKRRAHSKGDFVNYAYDIYSKTVEFLVHLSPRYGRVYIENTVRLAHKVYDEAEIALPSALDNRLKSQLSIKGAGHYMDDYLAAMPDIEALRAVAADTIERAEAMGIPVNHDKSRVIPFGKPFRYCKAGYIITPTGGVKVKGNRTAGTRAYKKLRALHEKYQRGEITRADIDNSYQSSLAYFDNYDDHKRKLRLMRLYYSFFGKG